MENNKEVYRLQAEFCKFMSNPKRIEVLFLLGEKEMCVEELAEKIDIKLPNLSQHLAVMREKGVVAVRREGTKMYYSIINPKILQACVMIRDIMLNQMKEE